MTLANGGRDVTMGALVLLQEEGTPVVSAMLNSGLEITALHDHFFFENSRICHIHVMGHGTPEHLAHSAKPRRDLTRNRAEHSAQLGGNPPVTALGRGKFVDAAIARILWHKGEQSGVVYKITVGQDGLRVKDMGAAINTRMGLNTLVAFTGNKKDAMVAGDVAMLEKEGHPMLKALCENGLDVVTIDQHMIGSQPEIVFLHYWSSGPANKLATSFKAALDQLGGALWGEWKVQ